MVLKEICGTFSAGFLALLYGSYTQYTSLFPLRLSLLIGSQNTKREHACHSMALDCTKKYVGRCECRLRKLSTGVLDTMRQFRVHKARRPEGVFA